MRTLIFGDPFLAGRTQRCCGGELVNLETHRLEESDTLFVQSGALVRPVNGWKTNKAILALGATLEDPAWQEYFKNTRGKRPFARSFYMSAQAIRKFNRLRRKFSFWDALARLDVRVWVEPQLRNWYQEKLRVLQVVTTLQVGGAEKMALDLARMKECVGVVSWFPPKSSPLRKPDYDLSKLNNKHKLRALIRLARRLHVDVVHTHLLTADVNACIERFFPVVTTMHNTAEGWPRGYDRMKPGLLVACSQPVAEAIGPQARVAWNGVSMEVTRRPRVAAKKQINLISVANFRTQKRHYKLPAILKALKEMGYSPRLTIVGEVLAGNADSRRSHEKFWAYAKRLGVDRRIEERPTLDVRSMLARNHVFVSVSAHEGLSLAQLEALGAGLPVVTTEVGGAPDIKRDVNSDAYYTLPVNARADSFAQAILKVWQMPRKSRLPQAFASETMRKRYLWLYYSALARGAQNEEIWLVINNFSMGGAQSSAKRLIKHWQPHQKVRAFTLQESSTTKGTRELLQHGIQVENLPGKNPRDRAFALMRLCAKSRPRAIFFWNTMPQEKCLIADALNVPIIDVSPGEMYFKELNRYFEKPLVDLPIRTPADYGRLLQASVVKYERESVIMSQYLGRQVYVVPNGVNGILPTPRLFEKARVFGTAARIARHKRLEDLIEAFRGIDAPLLIAGRIEPGAEDYARELKRISPPNVRWLGEQNIQEFLPQLDIFVMISEPAGCPNASLEAMCSGLPLLITDVGGANEQAISGLNGWLVPPRRPAEMHKAILEALALPASTLKVMAKASLYRSEHFSMEKMAQRYMALIPALPAARLQNG
jgi:glycosyltransferase involved in cell wall biosynthesis